MIETTLDGVRIETKQYEKEYFCNNCKKVVWYGNGSDIQKIEHCNKGLAGYHTIIRKTNEEYCKTCEGMGYLITSADQHGGDPTGPDERPCPDCNGNDDD